MIDPAEGHDCQAHHGAVDLRRDDLRGGSSFQVRSPDDGLCHASLANHRSLVIGKPNFIRNLGVTIGAVQHVLGEIA